MKIEARVVTSLRDVLEILGELERTIDEENEEMESITEERNEFECKIDALDSEVEDLEYRVSRLLEENEALREQNDELTRNYNDVVFDLERHKREFGI